jgi:hypothetical protein
VLVEGATFKLNPSLERADSELCFEDVISPFPVDMPLFSDKVSGILV